jgi:NitT/TauT family transport system ATP-binding protein
MIEFSHVNFGYRGHKNILTDFSLTLQPGERICLFGPSGCGKTTAVRLLLGLEKPKHGSITGVEGLRFSAVFQEDRLLEWKTVKENVVLFSDDPAASEILGLLGLTEVADALPSELSGGQKRRAALARALAHPFDVLVMDEALTGLDAQAKAQCLTVIDRVVGQRMLVLVTHEAAEAETLHAQRILF